VCAYADEVVSFDTEDELRGLIEMNMPCIIVKGPDYAGKVVTGDDLAPVIILDSPEPESVKRLKIEAYGQLPGESCKTGTL
jgi:bifunctional ADP-heptose synthase (sugar kinase/adenylyltransferase)